MTFSHFRQSTAICILSVTLGSVSSLAQNTNEKTTNAKTTTADTPPVQGKVVEDIVARVNDQIITSSDYDRAAEQLTAEAGQQSIPPHELEQKKADLLRDLIDQQLLLSKGKELGITGETELIKRLDEIRKQNHLEAMDDLEKAAQQQGVSYEDFKANIRNSIITQQVVRDEVGRRISMSPGEVQAYFKAHESEFAQPESVALNEILVPTPAKAATEAADTADVAAAQAQAEEIEKKLAAGAKFDDLAKPAPTDPNAPKIVVLGEYRRGMLAKDFEDKAFALNAGEHTQPIRTKQGFIILQATQHNPGGAGSFKNVEPQVEEALFLERMQPKLREYLTKLREEAAIDIKPGAVDSGASGNEMKLSYSAYTPPAPKKPKKFQRARFRGRDRSRSAQTQTAKTAAPATAPAATAPAAPAATKPAPTQQASNNQGTEKPGKREKIRFGQAPREALPTSQVATAAAPDTAGPAVTTPETRYVNPDGTVSGEQTAAPERKTRLSARPVVHKAKTPKTPDTSNQPTPEELAAQKVQNAPMGLTDPNADKKPKPKPEKTRYSAKPKEEDNTQPYLGKPETAPQAAPAASQPAVPGTPAAGTPQ
jgi:peptidyl-prolyl cis-trans isomerase SurA